MSVIITISIVLLFLMLIALIMWMQRKSNRNLLDLAFVDPITGGLNRARFEKEASEAIAGNPACTFALASMDIQKFKLINDCFGSDAGNQTLKHVYQVICKHLREGEFAARLTADNFNILMRNGPQKELIERLEKIVEDINSFNKSLESKYYLPFSEGVYIIDDPALNLITIQDRANVAPVSYTHLDVYKRQRLALPCSVSPHYEPSLEFFQQDLRKTAILSRRGP